MWRLLASSTGLEAQVAKDTEQEDPHTPLQLPQNVAVEYISPTPAVIQVPAPVVEFIQPTPVVI